MNYVLTLPNGEFIGYVDNVSKAELQAVLSKYLNSNISEVTLPRNLRTLKPFDTRLISFTDGKKSYCHISLNQLKTNTMKPYEKDELNRLLRNKKLQPKSFSKRDIQRLNYLKTLYEEKWVVLHGYRYGWDFCSGIEVELYNSQEETQTDLFMFLKETNEDLWKVEKVKVYWDRIICEKHKIEHIL